MAEQTVREQLVEALEAGLNYLPTCKGKDGDDCGPKVPYKLKCLFMKARAALDRARAEPECRCDGPECPGYQEGLEAERRPLRC